MQKIDMGGNKPRHVWSLNLDSVKFYLLLVGGLIVVLTFILGGMSAAGGWMTAKTDRHIHDELKEAVKPPDGIIYEAIGLAVERNNVDLDERMDRYEKEQGRQGGMTEQIYERVTGLDPPPRVE